MTTLVISITGGHTEPTSGKDTLPYTWWLKRDDPAVDIINKETGADDLADMAKDLGIYLFQNRDGQDTVFACRFEFPKYQKDFQIFGSH